MEWILTHEKRGVKLSKKRWERPIYPYKNISVYDFAHIENSDHHTAMALLLRRYEIAIHGRYDRYVNSASQVNSVAVRGRAITIRHYSDAMACY